MERIETRRFMVDRSTKGLGYKVTSGYPVCRVIEHLSDCWQCARAGHESCCGCHEHCDVRRAHVTWGPSSSEQLGNELTSVSSLTSPEKGLTAGGRDSFLWPARDAPVVLVSSPHPCPSRPPPCPHPTAQGQGSSRSALWRSGTAPPLLATAEA